MHSLYMFGDQLPHGLDILMGRDFQMPLLEEVEEEGTGDEEEREERGRELDPTGSSAGARPIRPRRRSNKDQQQEEGGTTKAAAAGRYDRDQQEEQAGEVRQETVRPQWQVPGAGEFAGRAPDPVHATTAGEIPQRAARLGPGRHPLLPAQAEGRIPGRGGAVRGG